MDPANLALMGQKTCIAALRHFVLSEKFGHALLLATHDAIALEAVASWCTAHIICTAKLSDPCGTCEGCTSLKREDGLTQFHATLGDSSVYAVENIREIRKYLALRSVQSGRRVVRIDNVEKCTPASANALLKILEEPGNNVVFILTTTSPNRVLATIRSRAMLYRLQPVPRATMEQTLKSNGVPAKVIANIVSAAPGQLGQAAVLAMSPEMLTALISADNLAASITTQAPAARFRSLAKYFEGKQEPGSQREQARSLLAAFARRVATDSWIQQRLGRLLSSALDLHTNSQPKLILEAFIA